MTSILRSLLRGLPRIAILTLTGGALISSSNLVPLLLGPTLAPLAFGFGLCLLGLAVGDAALRVLQPDVDAQRAAQSAQSRFGNAGENIGSGLVYLGRCILAAAILMLIVTAPRAGQMHVAEPPAAALPLLPILKAEQRMWWSDMPMPSALGGQVEQENPKWNPRTEFRTSRERGVGLGQITRTARFDALAEMKLAYPQALKDWGWGGASLYDPRMQLRGLVLMDLRNWKALADVPRVVDRLAMMLAGYNGGMGGVASDRRVCAATAGCDPSRWWGHVEHTSLKARTAVPGYGKSFFVTNREYPRNILLKRRARYLVLDT